MHILVVNDDGPPSRRLSPYIRPLVDELQANGHQVSVAIPAASRSWIGKAHLIEAKLTASYVHKDSFREDGSWDEEYQPEEQHTNGLTNGLTNGNLTNGTTATDNDGNGDDGPTQDEWVIIENGTPASCTQLGLHNLFTNRPQIDLVISGPNHGRNASTIYNLSSGTVGGALEAVFCGKRGIAISFGSKDEQPADVIAAAARLAVRVVGFLYKHWDERVELYNINVPMRVDVEERPVIYTRTLPYYWNRGVFDLGKKGVNGVNGAVNGGVNGVNGHEVKSRKRQFKWSADLSDMKKTMQESEEGTDAHTVLNGSTSVTALRANFWHVPGLEGPLDV
ncbi:hypothetical protein N7485_002581 [Penicillium canescens]|nr:hypothetical protein N7485_002581 [Penicillium canescens]